MSIQSEINRLNAAKAELKTSIENGGVTVSLNAKIDAYPALVDAITQQIKDKVDAINGEVVEGDVDAKLNKITSTKTDLAAALAEKGQTVGDVFSTYGDAVRAIETGGKSSTITFGGQVNRINFINKDGESVSGNYGSGQTVELMTPCYIYKEFSPPETYNYQISGDIQNIYSFPGFGGEVKIFYVFGDCNLTITSSGGVGGDV